MLAVLSCNGDVQIDVPGLWVWSVHTCVMGVIWASWASYVHIRRIMGVVGCDGLGGLDMDLVGLIRR